MSQPEPIFVSHLFRELHGHLLVLLRSLTPEDWHRPTVCSAWCVKDIASHLLDGNLRRLSIQRDGYAPPDAPCGFDSHEALVAYLTKLNTDLDPGHPPPSASAGSRLRVRSRTRLPPSESSWHAATWPSWASSPMPACRPRPGRLENERPSELRSFPPKAL